MGLDVLTEAGAAALVVSALITGGFKLFYDRELATHKAALDDANQKSLTHLRAKLSSKNQVEMAALSAQVRLLQKDQDARRDYEYEARKRLYEECEPLLFQLVELSNNALRRIQSLARTARMGNLEPREGWLKSDKYYKLSTIYTLFAPLVIFKLIQRRLTLIDLGLDPYIADQYRLAKCLYLSTTDDFTLAGREPKLDYAPDDAAWEEKVKTPEKQHWRQGIYLGVLDNLIEALIVDEAGRALRCKTFGEFSSEYRMKTSALWLAFNEASHLFSDFHPRTRPITWRILATQALIYGALLRPRPPTGAAATSLEDYLSKAPALTASELNELDWRSGKDEATPGAKCSLEDAVAIPMAAARAHVIQRLDEVAKPFRR